MIRIDVLASSSKGNATLIRTEKCRILVDAGISCKRIVDALKRHQITPRELDAVFITHEHKDHCCGLGQLSKKFDLNIYCTTHCSPDLRAMAPQARFHNLQYEQSCELDDCRITPVETNHDSVAPAGFIFESRGVRLGYLTDTGHISKKIIPHFYDLDGLFLESNYDPQMLQQSNRPYSLVQRIAGAWGHLSNEQAGDFVHEIASPRLQHIILAHLSAECNTPELAVSHMQARLTEKHLSTEVRCAHPVHGLESIVVEERFQLV